MAALSNPFRRCSQGWGVFIHGNHAARGENCSSWWRCLCDVCLDSKKSSKQEVFVPAGTHLGVKLLSVKSFWATQAYTIPFTLWPFSQWNIRNNQCWSVWLMLLKQVLAWWRHLVDFRTAMNLLHWAMHMVSYRCTKTAIKTTSKVGTFVIVVLFAVSLAATGAIWSK